MIGDLDGLVAAVTGGASGTGATVAREPAAQGARVAVLAGAVAYLASPRSGPTTGTSIAVDGGMQDLRLRPRP